MPTHDRLWFRSFRPSPSLASWIPVLLAAQTSACSTPTRRPVFPIGLYGVRSTNDYRAIAQTGFNLIVTDATPENVSAAQANGLQILASPESSAGSKFDPKRMAQSVRTYDRHPVLWAWYLSDEPDLHGIAPSAVGQVHRAIRQAGGRKPTALALQNGASAAAYATHADILMVDRYPVPWLPIATVPQHLRLARATLGPRKPLIAIIQAFDWDCHRQLLPGKTNLRPPTYEEIRCMTYCALIRGATGLFYYAYDDGPWKIREHPVTWNALEEVVREVHEREPLFTAAHLWWPLQHDYPVTNQAYNAALESSIATALLWVEAGTPSMAPGAYLVSANTTGDSVSYRFRIGARNGEAVGVLGEERRCQKIDGWISDTFAPYAVHIYGPMSLNQTKWEFLDETRRRPESRGLSPRKKP